MSWDLFISLFNYWSVHMYMLSQMWQGVYVTYLWMPEFDKSQVSVVFTHCLRLTHQQAPGISLPRCDIPSTHHRTWLFTWVLWESNSVCIAVSFWYKYNTLPGWIMYEKKRKIYIYDRYINHCLHIRELEMFCLSPLITPSCSSFNLNFFLLIIPLFTYLLYMYTYNM